MWHLRYLEILFTAKTCDLFGAAWNHATCATTCITFGLDVVTYSRLPIIDLYFLRSVDFESSTLLNLQLVCMGVITGLQYSILNLFSISLIYLVWEIKNPWFLWYNWFVKQKFFDAYDVPKRRIVLQVMTFQIHYAYPLQISSLTCHHCFQK